MATKKTSKKAKPSDLGTGGARKAADAIVARKKAVDKVVNSTATNGQKKSSITTKTGPTIDMSNPTAYRKYQLEKAKEDMMKKKKKAKK